MANIRITFPVLQLPAPAMFHRQDDKMEGEDKHEEDDDKDGDDAEGAEEEEEQDEDSKIEKKAEKAGNPETEQLILPGCASASSP